MHALRTTLILGSFWLLVFLAGVYQVHFRMAGRQDELQAKEVALSSERQASEELVAGMAGVEEELGSVQRIWTYRSKAIPRRESSHETYDYLDQILAKHRTSLDFDYLTAEVNDSGGVRTANYRVLGESRFADLYRFLWYLEHQPRYIRINSLQFSHYAKETTEESMVDPGRWVMFELNLSALTADRTGFDEVQFASAETAPETPYDPFEPPSKITARVPENVLGLPNIFESTLRAMTPTQIYLTDQRGELKVLLLGDEVYLGRLVDILPDENRAVFDLDQLMPPRQVSLQIKADN
jgi:hypothetical protein